MVNFEAMKIELLLFGIAVDIVGRRQMTLKLDHGQTVDRLKRELHGMHPELQGLNTVRFAVNSSYVPDDHVLQEGDEIALIPPVSGG